MFSGFGENPKTGTNVGRTGNETGIEYLQNDSNDLLQTWYSNIFLLSSI